MELYEQLVSAYLTKDPYVFVSPQYSIRSDDAEWSCPDLVALNFRDRLVAIVEVSTAWNPKALRDRVANCDTKWIAKLRDQLRAFRVIDESWTFEVQVFVRAHAARAFDDRTLPGGTPVRVFVLDNLGAPWDWERERTAPANPA